MQQNYFTSVMHKTALYRYCSSSFLLCSTTLESKFS